MIDLATPCRRCLSIAFGEAGWRHPRCRFNLEPVCCSCSGRLGVIFARPRRYTVAQCLGLTHAVEQTDDCAPKTQRHIGSALLWESRHRALAPPWSAP
jgi:hypothetical protein